MNYISRHPNSFYFTSRHNIIEEMLNKFNFRHVWWEGLTEKCPKRIFPSSRNDTWKNLSSIAICGDCNYYPNCNYWTQFKKKPPIFGVFEHVPNRFKEWINEAKTNNDPLPDIVELLQVVQLPVLQEPLQHLRRLAVLGVGDHIQLLPDGDVFRIPLIKP